MRRSRALATVVLLLLLASCDAERRSSVASTDTSQTTSDSPATPTPGTPAPPAEPRVAFATASNVDENLFMVRMLESFYDDFPGETSGDEITSWLRSTRTNVAWARETIRRRQLDPDVDGLYENALRLVDAYETYLAKIGVAAKARQQQDAVDAIASLWHGYRSTGEYQEGAKNLGMSKDDAETAGKIASVFDGLSEYGERQTKAENAQETAVAGYRRELDAARYDVSARARSAAAMLTERYGWRPGEAGFDGFRSKVLRALLRRRPRDPFLKVRYANVRVEKETAEDVLRDAQSCWEAAELVPSAPVYDWLRNDYLDNAAELACLAASTEAGAAGYSARPRLGHDALAFAHTVLDLDPKDAGGRGHAALARALAMTGRYDEAVTAANGALDLAPEAWRNDPFFCFRYASMLSLSNQVENIGGWISRAYQDGLYRADWIRGGADFENFRRGRPDEYDRLTKAKIRYAIDFGVFNDDVVITNMSPFMLSNLTVHVTIRKGSRTWSPEIKCTSVAAGQACKGENVVSIPNDKYDDMDATFSCDNCG